MLATIIGKRGEAALKGAPETLKAKVKEWLVDFWKAFGEALGLKDITPEQAAKMTLEQVADAIRAEMMSGKRFGEKAEGGQAERSSAINTGGMRFSLEMKKQKGNPAVKDVADRIKGLLTGKIARTDSTIAYKESETDNRRLGTEAAKIYERYGNKEYKLPTGGVLYFAPDIRTVNAYNGDVAAAWGEYALHLITHTRGSGENRFRSFDGRNVDVILPMIENIIKENKVTQSDGRIIFFKQTRKAESKSKSRYAYIVTEPDDAGNLRVDLRYITGVEGRGFLPGKTATLEEVIPNRTAEGRALHQNQTPQIVSQEGGGKQERLKYSIGGGVDGEDVAAWLLNGRLRLADDAKYGLAERSSAISTPIEVMTPSGDLKVMKPVEFAFSSLVELYQWMRGSPALPKILTKAHQEKRAWLGRITKGSEVELNPEMFGIVSKSDEVRIKAELKAEGRSRHEDPGWNMRHTKKQNDFEKMMSENALEDRLRSLSEDRVKGKALGEYALCDPHPHPA